MIFINTKLARYIFIILSGTYWQLKTYHFFAMQCHQHIMLTWQPTELDSTWNLMCMRMLKRVAHGLQMDHASVLYQLWKRMWRMWCFTARGEGLEGSSSSTKWKHREIRGQTCTWCTLCSCVYIVERLCRENFDITFNKVVIV